MVKETNDKNFKDEVLSKDLAIVDFWASWCGPCKNFAPVFEKTSKKFGNISFFKLNVDENPKTPASYQVMSIPTIIIFKKGEPKEKLIGMQSAADLEAKLKSL